MAALGSSENDGQRDKAAGWIVIERVGGFWKDRLRSYVVEVDGGPVGRVAEYATLTIPVPGGDHDVVVKIDFLTSRRLWVHVDTGTTARLVCAAGRVSGFERTGGYVKLWEGQLTDVAPPASPLIDP